MLSRSASAITIVIAIIGAVVGVLTAGDSRYVMAQVYEAEQKAFSSQVAQISMQVYSVQQVVLKSDRRTLQNDIFHLELKNDTLTDFEKSHLQGLRAELEDIKHEIAKPPK